MSFFEELKRRNVVRVGIAYGVAAWLLIQVTDIVFPRIGLPDSAVTLVIALLGIGFIPALIFAWAFEMTPEGIKREADIERAESVTPKTGNKLDRLIIAALAVIVAWFVFDELYLERSADQPSRAITNAAEQAEASANQSIAVLPFVNMSGDAENEYFSDGISEELLNVLARVGSLHVASRTSSFAYKGKNLPIPQIARELNVNHILEGSVRKAGNEVRITAQLIDAINDRHLWSDTYQRELDDIFDIQVEISNNIVNALKLVLNVDEASDIERLQRPTDSAEAYELYLLGRHQWRLRTEESLLNAIGSFEKAIELDPSFARAYEALASTHVVLPSWSDVVMEEAISSALDAANSALQLDGSLAEAHAIRAHALQIDYQWASSMREFENALNLEPRNATAHQWYAEFLNDIGYRSVALKHIRMAYELDPASPVINMVYAAIASANLEDDLAIKHANQAKELGLNSDRALLASLPVIIRRGDLEKHQETLLAYLAGSELMKLCLQAVLNPKLFDLVRQGLDNEPPGRRRTFCATLVGDIDRALEYLEAEVRENSTNFSFAWDSNPGIRAVRQSSGFKELLNEFGLLGFFQENGWPDVCRAVGDEDFECD